MNQEILNKTKAMAYVQSEAAVLSEQCERSERVIGYQRALAAVFAIKAGGLVTKAEFDMLMNEIETANSKSVVNILREQRS